MFAYSIGEHQQGSTISDLYESRHAQLKRFCPEHNLPITEKNSLEQAAFWHEVKVVCCLLTPILY